VFKDFPILRSPGYEDPKTNKVEGWWLSDGHEAWRVDELSDAENQLSLKSIMNDTLLIDPIISGWTLPIFNDVLP